MGLNALLKRNRWSIVLVEKPMDGVTEIEGQFVAQATSEDIRANWTELSTLGREQPILQFVNGGSDRLSFQAMFHSDPSRAALGDPLVLKRKVELLKLLCRKDSELGRPPIVLFSIGTEISIRAVVESVGQIRYDEPWSDGRLRAVLFSVSLLRHEALTLEITDPRVPVRESLEYHPVSGDSFESLARQFYNSPIHGDYLRQHAKNVALTDAETGALAPESAVHIPSKSIALRVQPSATSIPLTRSDTVKARMRALAERHSGSFRARVAVYDT